MQRFIKKVVDKLSSQSGNNPLVRRRSTLRWEPEQWFPNVEAYLKNPVTDGFISISYDVPSTRVWNVNKSRRVDFLIRDRKSDSTLITFHASIKESMASPVFVGDQLAKDANMNLIALADPSVNLYKDLNLGWYLGNDDLGDYVEYFSPILQGILGELGSGRNIFWGSSGGGFAALRMALMFEGSVAFLVNPRLDLRRLPDSKFESFLTRSFPNLLSFASPDLIKNSIQDQISLKLPNSSITIAIYQNSGDVTYRRNQFRPFVLKHKEESHLWTRVENDGRGHRPVPRQKIVETLLEISEKSRSLEESLVNSKFERVF